MEKILKFINKNPTFIIWISCGIIFSIVFESQIWFFTYLGIAFAILNNKEVGKSNKENSLEPQEAEIVKPKPSKK